MTLTPGGSPREKNAEHVVIPGGPVPVVADVDVVVLGGSFRGIGAALAAARSGRSVLLTDPGTYLGHEVTRTGRWWLSSAELTRVDDELRETLLTGASAPDASGEVALWPDGVKRGLEDLLLGAGVQLLYGCHHISTHHMTDRLSVVVGTKGGRRVLRSTAVVDATTSDQQSRASAVHWYTVELTDAPHGLRGRVPVPGDLEVVGDEVHLHGGYLGDGHVHAEFGLRAGSAPTSAEWEVRQRVMTLLEYLLAPGSALGGSWLATVSAEPLIGDAPPAAAPATLLAEGAALLRDAHSATDRGPSVARVKAGSTELALDVVDTPSRRPGRPRRTEVVPALPVPVIDRVQVLVVGAGTSGVSAAAAAAGEGMETLVIDMNASLGGTGTLGAVDSYWYGRRKGLVEEVRGRTRSVQRRLGQRATGSRWNVEVKAHAVLDLVVDRGARVRTRSLAVAALCDGDRVVGAVIHGPHGVGAVVAEVVIDATGDADVAAFAGADLRYGADRTHTTMWYSLAQIAEPGRSRNNFGGFVDVTDVADYTRAILAARRRGGRLHDHGSYVASRETRNIVGRSTMSLTDQLTSRHWSDVINVHFSNHDIKGKSESIWTLQGLIPPNLEIEIPLSALLPRDLDGVVVVGKAMSVTHDGLAAVRMQADQENLGGIVGILAAQCVRESVGPRDVDVRRLQNDLVARGLLSSDLLEESEGPRWQVPGHTTSEGLVTRLFKELPLLRYADVGMAQIHREGIPFVELIVRDDLPVEAQLLAALASSDPAHRQVAAQVLTCRGRRVGIDTILTELRRLLGGAEPLPARTARVRHVQLPPDQAAMPMPAYLLYTLGVARDLRAVEIWEDVVRKVDSSDAALRDMHAGTFAYIDAVCFGAERLGDPAAVPLLLELHRRPTLQAQYHAEGLDPDIFSERRAMLELAIGRALARCGAEKGFVILLHYLRDNRAQLARAAHSELTLLHGTDLGDDPAVWERACAGQPAGPSPLPARYDLYALDGRVVRDFDGRSKEPAVVGT